MRHPLAYLKLWASNHFYCSNFNRVYRAIAAAALLWVGICMPSGTEAQSSTSAKPSATATLAKPIATATLASAVPRPTGSPVPSGVAANVAVASFLAHLSSKFLVGASECLSLKVASDYEMCMMRKVGSLLKPLYSDELPAFVVCSTCIYNKGDTKSVSDMCWCPCCCPCKDIQLLAVGVHATFL